MKEQKLEVSHLASLATKNTFINPQELKDHHLKRGLRNSDGTGVLVGATKIASVEGYKKVDHQPIPTKGKLNYRGISVEELVRGYQNEHRFGYEEIIYLLLFGSLPNKNELTQFKEMLNERMALPSFFAEDVILKNPSKNIMNTMQRAILALYTYDKKAENLSLVNQVNQILNIIGKMPLILAYSFMNQEYYYNNKSLVLHSPKTGLSIAENILHLIRPDNHYTELEAEILDLALILHAEHGGGNNSTFAIHVVSSTGTDVYSAISTAIGSLKGAKHGGANACVEGMVTDLKENTVNWQDDNEIRDYLNLILDKKAYDRKGLVYGMGHAVYTLSDPRSVLLKEKAYELAKIKGWEAEFNLLDSIERQTKELLSERKGKEAAICSNVDLYSGLVYKMLGIDESLFTPLFALSRVAGWSAHRLEQIQDEKIIRPAYLNLVNNIKYQSLDERK